MRLSNCLWNGFKIPIGSTIILAEDSRPHRLDYIIGYINLDGKLTIDNPVFYRQVPDPDIYPENPT